MSRSELVLTPFMEIALRTMKRAGPLAYGNGGWRSPDGKRFFNSHTIGWLRARGYCEIKGAAASITASGIQILAFAERMAA